MPPLTAFEELGFGHTPQRLPNDHPVVREFLNWDAETETEMKLPIEESSKDTTFISDLLSGTNQVVTMVKTGQAGRRIRDDWLPDKDEQRLIRGLSSSHHGTDDATMNFYDYPPPARGAR